MAAVSAAGAAVKTTAQGSLYFNTLIAKLQATPGKKKVNENVRKAIESGHLWEVIRCIQQPKQSNITLRSPGVLKHTIRGLRRYPQQAEWSIGSIDRSLSQAKLVNMALDSEEQGYGKVQKSDDPRKRPQLLGAYLELAAARATKTGGEDVDGAVKRSADRLLSIFERHPELVNTSWEPPATGQVDVVMDNVPVWHGLSLAQRILGGDMPRSALAKKITEDYGKGLRSTVDKLKSKQPKEGTYAADAIWIWENCIRA